MLGKSLPALAARKSPVAPPLLVQAPRSSPPPTFSTLRSIRTWSTAVDPQLLDARGARVEREELPAPDRAHRQVGGYAFISVTGSPGRQRHDDDDDGGDGRGRAAQVGARRGPRVFELADLRARRRRDPQTSGEPSRARAAARRQASPGRAAQGRARGRPRPARACVDKLAHESASRAPRRASWVAKHRYWSGSSAGSRRGRSTAWCSRTRRARARRRRDRVPLGRRARVVQGARHPVQAQLPSTACRAQARRASSRRSRALPARRVPSSPRTDMTDDCLKAAIEGAPPRAMIVPRTSTRSSTAARARTGGASSPLTFSACSTRSTASAARAAGSPPTPHEPPREARPRAIRCGRVATSTSTSSSTSSSRSLPPVLPRLRRGGPPSSRGGAAVLSGRPVAGRDAGPLHPCRRAARRASPMYVHRRGADCATRADENWRKTRNTGSVGRRRSSFEST